MQRFFLVLIAALTLAIYTPGLHGPFLLDDIPNIVEPMQAWFGGSIGWQEFVLGNRSGMLGRTISMLSFAANGGTTGLDAAAMKATNIGIHITCGGLLYSLLLVLLSRDHTLQSKRHLIALAITTLWLIHPLHVSTVLYVVQRMTQLSALFSLAALLIYVYGRVALENGRNWLGLSNLFVFLPLAVAAATFSKENGALIPLLCGVIEIAYFHPCVGRSRNWPVRTFFIAFLLIPAVLVLTAFPVDRIISGYEGRLFTLAERLLTQPRVLLDYIHKIVLPSGPSLGLYTDDFALSRGLFQPISTIISLFALTCWAGAAWVWRRRSPAFFCGTGVFMCAHAMEASVFPLELYFEHRNYLPSAGLFLAVTGLLGWAMTAAKKHGASQRLPPILGIGLALYISLLASATWARSSVWSTWTGIVEQGVSSHPTSHRANVDYFSSLMFKGQYGEGRAIMEQMLALDNPASRHTAAITLAWLDCLEGKPIENLSIERIENISGARLQLAELFAIERISGYILENDCVGLGKSQLAHLLREMTARSNQDAGLVQIWRVRLMASRLFAADGSLPLAVEQASLSWMTGKADPAAGVFLTNLFYAQGDFKSARLIASDVAKRLPLWDHRGSSQLHRVVYHFDGAEAADALIEKYGLTIKQNYLQQTNSSE